MPLSTKNALLTLWWKLSLFHVPYVKKVELFFGVLSKDKLPLSLEVHQFLIKADPADYFDVS